MKLSAYPLAAFDFFHCLVFELLKLVFECYLGPVLGLCQEVLVEPTQLHHINLLLLFRQLQLSYENTS